jgi:hypothetical protein
MGSKKMKQKSDILTSLLGKGYFPKELPLTFTTKTFGAKIDLILPEWQRQGVFKIKYGRKVKKQFHRDAYQYEIEDTEAETLSIPKRGFERRILHITHPVPQALLAKEFAENWRTVQKWLNRTMFSLDRIETSDHSQRALKEINFNSHNEKKLFIESNNNFIISTDISRFYPTIYTHSITWAAYGKERVKSARELYNKSLADRIDTLVRKCNRNQTVGIPIGPDTSRIVADIISARIDHDFFEQNKILLANFVGQSHFKLPKGSDQAQVLPSELERHIDRLQDDWTIGVNSTENAEKILSGIQKAYRAFGLDINGSKTAIEKSIFKSTPAWIAEIRSFLRFGGGGLAGSRLEDFLSLAIRLQLKHPGESVLNFALNVLDGQHTRAVDTPHVEAFLMKAAVIAPSALDTICRIILNINYKNRNLSRKRIGERLSQLLQTASENGYDYEVIWILHTFRGLRHPVNVRKLPLFENPLQNKSSAISLVLLEMNNSGLVIGSLPIQNWENQITEELVLRDQSWLLAYEGIRNGWLKDINNLKDTPFFRPMYDNGVTFYDPKRNIKKPEIFQQAQHKRRQANIREAKFILSILRQTRGPLSSL